MLIRFEFNLTLSSFILVNFEFKEKFHDCPTCMNVIFGVKCFFVIMALRITKIISDKQEKL